MNVFIILLLVLGLRVAHGLNPTGFIPAKKSQDVEVMVLSEAGSDKCPKVMRPVCATNGKEFLYFQNKCHMEVKNYEYLTRGLMEYFECPLIYCKTGCAKCEFLLEPVCAASTLTGEKKMFDNACEVERTMCRTKRAWTVVDVKHCFTNLLNRILKPLNNILENSDCPVFCAQEHRPVCARFMSREKEFANECQLKAARCQTQQDWHIIRQGPCQPPNFKAGSQISAAATASKCSKICPSAYKPICAKFHNELRLFNNRCELDNINCQFGHHWQIVKEGYCVADHKSPLQRECPEFCLNEHEPVCAGFGEVRQEFRNLCEVLKTNCLTNKNWQILKLGPCVTNSKQLPATASKCSQTCDKSYKPVCAKFKWKLKEFRNQCELQKTICETNTDWKLLRKTGCPLATDLGPKCPKKCPKELNPVCASYNGQFRQFSNSCQLDKTSCVSNTGWKFIKWGSCPALNLTTSTNSSACPRLCPKEYRPVCAKFQAKLKEFHNECEMQRSICQNNTNWQLLKTGRCPLISANKDPCSRICTKQFSPVCARFKGKLREFFNSCELEKIACKTNTSWAVVHRGPCFVDQFKRLVENSCDHEIMDPVCAIHDYRIETFDNVCQMAIEIERSGNIWSILHKGACSDTTSSTKHNVDATNINNSATAATTGSEGKYLKHAGSLKNDSKINDQDDEEEGEYDEEADDVFIDSSRDRVDKANYGRSTSSEESSLSLISSGDDEIFRQWAEAQVYSLNSDEDQSAENDTSTSNTFVEHKNSTFNYAGYAQEDDASEEMYLPEKHTIDTLLFNTVTTNATKSSENFPEQYAVNQKRSQEEAAHPNDSQEVASRASELRKQNEKVSTSVDKNSQHNHLYESNLRKTEKQEKEQKLTKFGEEQIQTGFDETQNYTENKSDNESLYPQESSHPNNADSFEVNSSYGKLGDPVNSSNSNLQPNSIPNNNYSSVKSHNGNSTSKSDKSDAALHRPNNETSSKKDAIYNGIVYTAPVYDAPTYNFIYTAPINYPGFDVQHPDHNNIYEKQTKSEITAKVPFHPLHFFATLAGMNGTNFAQPNLMPLAQVDHDSVNQVLDYRPHLRSNEQTPALTPSSPNKVQNSLPAAKFANNELPVSAPPANKTYYSPPSLTQKLATPVNNSNTTQNSTLLNQIINTLKSLTNQV